MIRWRFVGKSKDLDGKWLAEQVKPQSLEKSYFDVGGSMAKRSLIHFGYGFFEFGDWKNLCNGLVYGECSLKWKDVDCRRCLEKRDTRIAIEATALYETPYFKSRELPEESNK